MKSLLFASLFLFSGAMFGNDPDGSAALYYDYPGDSSPVYQYNGDDIDGSAGEGSQQGTTVYAPRTDCP
jgi:hypothetical protein